MARGGGHFGSAHRVILLCRAITSSYSWYKRCVDWEPDRFGALQALFFKHYGFTAGIRLLVRLLQAEERLRRGKLLCPPVFGAYYQVRTLDRHGTRSLVCYRRFLGTTILLGDYQDEKNSIIS